MTEELKTLLHESADIDFATPDVAAITRAGDQVVRRRRLVTGAAGLAAAAVVAGGVLVTSGGSGGDGGPHVASEPPPSTLPAGMTWAQGSMIHTSSGDIDTGHPVRAYVRAGDDFAFTDGKGAVYSVVDGVVERIGSTTTERPRLVSDPTGSLVAWLDPAGPEYVAHDLVDGAQGSWAAQPGENEFAGLVDVDGTEVVWRDAAGENAWNSEDGAIRTIDPTPAVDARLLGAGGGLLAWTTEAGLRVGVSRAEAVVLPNLHGGSAVISPGGRWVSIDADQMEVWDVDAGKRVPLDVGGRDFATAYEWLDEDTVAAIAIRDVEESGDTGDSPVELMVCEVIRGTCAVEATLGPVGDLAEKGWALPSGEAFED